MRLLRFVISGAFSRPVFARPMIAMILASAIVALHARAATESQRVNVTPGRSQQRVGLRDRLVVGLQARLKSEVAFVEKVVEQVQAGKLPQRIVDETFFWARDRASAKRNGVSRRPIIFFQPAMTLRAKRLKVDL